MAKKVDPFAKAIHDLCVAAGAECGARCDPGARKAADTAVKRTAQTSGRRRNLTVAEAGRMCSKGRQ
jgi:hypothetical protein